jgi:hypothetical protein
MVVVKVKVNEREESGICVAFYSILTARKHHATASHFPLLSWSEKAGAK